MTPGSNFVALDDCSIGCDVTAVAQSIPPRICAGESVTIDASGSTTIDCVGGILEYQLVDAVGVVAPWQPLPQFTDVMPAVPTTYTVEVRCSAFPTVCLDTVPVVVDVVVSDPAALPAIGPSLRLGNPDDFSEAIVPMRWTPDRAIAVALGEHYHVLRSDRPDGGWMQLNVPDPPLLQVEAFVDAAADQVGPSPQVYYYLAFVSDECHVDNRALDVFTTGP